jgi:Secretion system C-terminal sorting domain
MLLPRSIIAWFVLVLLIPATLAAQTFTPFKASEGKSTAVSSAKSGGFTGGVLTSIATLGDTTFFGSFLPANLKSAVNINMSKGTAAFWGYRFAQRINNVDSSGSYAVVKPLFFLAVPAPIPDLPDVPIRVDTALPATFMDSDIMLQKVAANPEYISYMQRFPKAKVQTAALGTSLPNRPVQTPLWIVFVGQTVGETTLSCIIEAADNNGACTCRENAVSSVHEYSAESTAVIYPNPVTGTDIVVSFSPDASEQDVNIRVYSALGSELLNRTLQRRPAGRVPLSIEGLVPGIYSVCINDGRRQEWLRVVKQ